MARSGSTTRHANRPSEEEASRHRRRRRRSTATGSAPGAPQPAGAQRSRPTARSRSGGKRVREGSVPEAARQSPCRDAEERFPVQTKTPLPSHSLRPKATHNGRRPAARAAIASLDEPRLLLPPAYSKKRCPMNRLDDDEVLQRLVPLRGWVRTGDSIRREYGLADFREALALVNRIGALAETANHHPDIELGWGRVVVILSTHDAGGITERDFDLARRIDS
jgi:4a-hydroxytetrahydrobiopterin dehydratase